MEFTRRGAMALGAGLAAALMLPAQALRAAADDKIAEFTGGAAMGEGGITLTTPEIAENGNTVPIEVNAPGAVEILVLASANPTPDVARVSFGPLAGAQRLSTRIRLGGTQDVIAIAKMADGSFQRAANTVKVTIGGCGG
ncbi:thiosulfate oxidation carrier protein SoxY [Rhodovulum sp. BSW8]|uniref:Thiosulfate oxidation carrier protein SoxY n=1 Tax=Rhodovulum visakhapatnamense TaxID=364297 RepID=A0ABS1RKW8_9RHOB|nr:MULTISPECIES: thiosulfate oxidation carrier protein SoxY [Rhodovulum]MBL3569727.1 thiosulfate oxidation carrier protein SoxY [Rhodovulum visakhapatnamense]MBL3580314.1 thiosulfate oxidation carrier protein SoxY [Rhodovulum visakhapatnamense]OLS44566.1 thiosulfate oxidation carrier protein SoxY [Rhodovulum sulfidophilum]RBO51817.1 thiosulfate oxidation carrier protein SoxY [Rhodovulum sp. BSW8]